MRQTSRATTDVQNARKTQQTAKRKCAQTDHRVTATTTRAWQRERNDQRMTQVCAMAPGNVRVNVTKCGKTMANNATT